MKLFLRGCVTKIFVLVTGILLFTTGKTYASHIYGADLFYTHVTSNTYTITLVLYGDCNLTNPPFQNLPSASPEIEIYNGSTLSQVVDLFIQSPTGGTEVTPVCSSQLNNTTCVSTSGTVPGVKKFTYSRTVNLGTTSSSWRFYFNGNLGSSGGQAGRSNTITNILVGTSSPSVMGLEATLNNSSAPNSSPTYTTIPTPFFCINKAASYNPGTVDPNSDGLSYSLVPGIEAVTSGTVTYLAGYSATAPLAVATGTFNFSSTTGQLNFTPNLSQRSLVVTKVEEYRNSVLVGTSMREMTFVVLTNCSNNPPGGGISNASSGVTVVNSTTITACKSLGTISFNINPTDLDGNAINVAASGIPTGASFTVTNNNTTAPIGAFSWNLAGVTPGTYNFFITYTDDGCPLSSKQTLAYSITVLPQPDISFALVSSATCSKKAKFNITPGGTSSPWTITVFQGVTTVHTFTNVTGTQLDSLSPGTYTIRVTGTNTCYKDTSITIAAPPAIIPSVTMVKPICNGGNDGSITLTATGGLAPFQYAIGAGAYSSTNTFTNLTAGSYTLHVKDANDCIKDTTVQLLDPPGMNASVSFVKPPCNFFNSGSITITGINGTSPYQYALGAGSYSATNTFSGLYSGSYTMHIKDANNCIKDTVVILPDSIKVHASAAVTNVLCNGASTGAITINGNSATAPYRYQLGSGTVGSNNTFTNLLAGGYNVHIEDTNNCYLDTVINITQPLPITSTSVVNYVSCNSLSDGSITITAAGGVGPYNYALGAGPYGSNNIFNGLAAGSYTIHIKDANDCLKDTTIAITQPAVLVITGIGEVQPNCYGTFDGSYTITASGGTTPYTYAIDANPFVATNIFGSLGAGSYVLHVKDANGCTRDSAVTLAQPTPVAVSAVVTKSVCATLANGKVVLTGSGGISPYAYAAGVGPYSSSSTFTPLTANTYFFHVKDNHNCVKDTIITIADSFTVSGTIVVTDVACNGDSTGSITVTGTGGVSPYTYGKGIAGAFTSVNTFNNLLALTYLIKVKDANGCRWDTASVTVLEPTKLKATVTPKDISCFGFNDGTITVNGTGGTPAYSYAIGTGGFSATNQFISLPIGTYALHVKDSKNCKFDTTITLTQPASLGISLTSTDVLCFGDTSGTVTVSGSGGTVPYAYRTDFNAYQAANTLTGIGAGPHVIRVRDSKGCYKDSNIVINQPTKLLITSLSAENPTCEGFADGSITVAGAGGTPSYVYATNGDPYGGSPTISGLLPGLYIVHVKDNNGCIHDTSITLTGYPVIVIDEVTPKDVSCFGFEDGKITVNASGGVQPLTYSIGSKLPGQNIFTGLKAGNHTIRITDSKNCTKDTTVNIGSPEVLDVTVSANKNDCEGYDDGGVVTSKVSGGTLPYSYAWNTNPVSYSADIRGLPNGFYKVIVTDANECADSSDAVIIYDNCCKPFIPDAFTPNNDGKNDKLRILFKGDMTLKVFSVFSRFGELVYTTDNINSGWDGTINGEPQDIGTYNYYVKIICGNKGNNEVEFKGTVTLIR